MESVSIILKVWNASRYVKVCLDTLLHNTGPDHELIIIDNGSKPKLKEYLRQKATYDPRLRLIENPVNRGPGHANQQGCEAASNRLVCLLDSDVLVPPGWLEKLIMEFQEHPELKLVSPIQHEENILYPFEPPGRNSRQAWYEVKRQYASLAPLEQFMIYSQGLSLEEFGEKLRQVNPNKLRFQQAPPDFISSCCALVNADFVNQVGGIADPDFRGYGSEDVDLCWRIGQAGGRIAKSSTVYVHHFQGASLEDNHIDRLVALRAANRILYAKWKDRLLEMCAQGSQEAGLVEYLESHIIFPALATNTEFIEDLRQKLEDPYIPEDITWRPD